MFRSIFRLAAIVFTVGLASPGNALDELLPARSSKAVNAVPAENRQKRSWGPEQVTGAPDAPKGGQDSSSAWASHGSDNQAEWLICEYAKPTNVVAIHVHENHCPGALVKITAFGGDGKEVVAWEGVDPTPRDKDGGVSTLRVGLGFDVQKIKLHLDSVNVAGWNEIDAVGLEDDKGEKHWATKVEASTTYATIMERAPFVEVAEPVDLKPALDKLQNDVNELKATQKELQREIRELKALLKESLTK